MFKSDLINFTDLDFKDLTVIWGIELQNLSIQVIVFWWEFSVAQGKLTVRYLTRKFWKFWMFRLILTNAGLFWVNFNYFYLFRSVWTNFGHFWSNRSIFVDWGKIRPILTYLGHFGHSLIFGAKIQIQPWKVNIFVFFDIAVLARKFKFNHEK